MLTERGLILKKGTIVDFTIISAPSSTKNANRQRDPEAHQVKKGNMWYFGYKAHAGVDEKSGLVHTLKVTPANQHDVTMTSELMHGDEERLYGDSGYLGADKRENAILKNQSGKKIKYIINRRPSQTKDLSARAKGKSSVENARSHRSEQRLNTFSQLSKNSFGIEKHAIEVCENRLQN